KILLLLKIVPIKTFKINLIQNRKRLPSSEPLLPHYTRQAHYNVSAQLSSALSYSRSLAAHSTALNLLNHHHFDDRAML
ncbi:MAG: hypothetical protein ACI9UT_001527, partial [Flavobacteriales bacterium]